MKDASKVTFASATEGEQQIVAASVFDQLADDLFADPEPGHVLQYRTRHPLSGSGVWVDPDLPREPVRVWNLYEDDIWNLLCWQSGAIPLEVALKRIGDGHTKEDMDRWIRELVEYEKDHEGTENANQESATPTADAP